MIGDAVPVKFSRRIGRVTRLSSVKNSIKIYKKTRRCPVKRKTTLNKRTHTASSLRKEVNKNGASRKSKSEKNSKQTSCVKPPLLLLATNIKVEKTSNSKSNCKQISKEVLDNLKTPVPKRSMEGKSKVIGQKRKTRNSLRASQLHLTDTERNFTFPKIKKEKKIGRKSRFKKGSKQISDVSTFLVNATKKPEIKQKNKSKINSKQIFKEAACKLKPAAHKQCKKDFSEISNENRKTRNSLNASQVNSIGNEKKKNTRKKNQTEQGHRSNEKQTNCKSLKVSNSLLLTKEKRKSKELNSSKLKSLKVKKLIQKKSSLIATGTSSKSFVIPNTEKSAKTSKHSERKKIARSSIKSLNQAISLDTPKSKLFITPNSGKITCTDRHSENRKSTRSSKQLNQSRILNSGILLNTPAFQSILETPHPKKRPGKKKSPRLLELSPLKTPNKQLPLSTPASIYENKHNSLINKSKSSKQAKFLVAANCDKKNDKRKASIKKIKTDSCEKLKLNQRQLVNKKKRASENFKMPLPKETENLLVDVLLTPAFTSRQDKNPSKKYFSKSNSEPSKRKFHALSTENLVRSNEVKGDKKRKKSAGCTNVPAKGTLKHKRWVLNNLKETNASYEDDIFENKNFGLYKTAFHFGDESDGSSVNIATPKFDCILTPALPKKTPRFKDCISTTELLQARKSAEEYLYRRNRKRKSGDKLSSSGKKTRMNKKNTTQDIPEKKKLDFEEAVNKLSAVQKNLERDAEIDDEDKDSYFSDSSI